MKCLITGNCGMIGSHLADKLIELGHIVVGIDNLSSGSLSNLNQQTIFYQRSILDDLSDIFSEHQFDYIFHLAAQINLRNSIINPKHDAEINIQGSLNVLEYCRKDKIKFVFASSGGSVYDPVETIPFTEQSKTNPMSPYGLAKQTVENYIRLYHQLYNLPYTILRYSNVYGARQNAHGEAGVIAIFIDKMMKGEKLKVFGDGEKIRDYIDVHSVVESNLLAMKDEITGTFNVSTNKSTTVNQIIKLLKQENNVEYVEPILGEMEISVLDNSKLINCGWRSETNIKDGIERTLKYYEALRK